MTTALKLARLRAGWTQPQLIDRMRQVATDLGEQLPGKAVMLVQIHRWENGHRRPGEFYRQLFCAVYQLPAEHLGFPVPARTADTGGGVVCPAAMAALPYTAPLTTAQLHALTPARVRLYAQVALADPQAPSARELADGLTRTCAEAPVWLDHERLHACDLAAQRATLDRATQGGAGAGLGHHRAPSQLQRRRRSVYPPQLTSVHHPWPRASTGPARHPLRSA